MVCELSAIFVFPVTLLCLVQFRNLLTNKTTFEKMRGPVSEESVLKSKLSKAGKVSLANCRVMCADNRSGSFTTTRSSFAELITEKYSS